MKLSSLTLSRLAALAFAASAFAASGCASDAPASEPFAVTSHAEQGLLARIDYADGGYVEFRKADDLVLIGGVFDRKGEDPLRGIHLSEVLPSELFSYLTGRAAPEPLLSAERELGLPSNPDAFASLLPAEHESGALGGVSQALVGQRFNELYCYPHIDYCGLNVTGDLRVDADGRVDGVEGSLDVLEGSLRMRIVRKRLVRGNDTLATYIVAADPSDPVVHIGAAAPGLDRKMWIVVDQADTAKYHFAADFRD
jgi:hypothetical protein